MARKAPMFCLKLWSLMPAQNQKDDIVYEIGTGNGRAEQNYPEQPTVPESGKSLHIFQTDGFSEAAG
jgi:hypothetical protein